MKKGDIVQFKEILEPGDDKAFFIVLEMRDPRVLVQALVDLPIPPTYAYRISELIVVKESEKPE